MQAVTWFRRVFWVGPVLAVLIVACGESGPEPAETPRPDRVLAEVAWDTVFHLQVPGEDTLLYAADQVQASEEGLWVLDRIGHRVAHFGWDGVLRWYAGRQGEGPGELLNPQLISLDDEGRIWVVDHGTGRISGFDRSGILHAEVPLVDSQGALALFVASRSGERFLGMNFTEELRPVMVDRSGRASEGRALSVPDAEGTWGFALQGRVAREPGGDRWVYAFSSGDGMFRMEGVEPMGGRIRYPEAIPFPRMIEEVEVVGERTSTTRRLDAPNFSGRGVAIAQARILVHFMGETPEQGRILDLYDFASGAYERSVLLPRYGQMSAWEDRVLLAINDPTPGVLVLRMVE
ncbi:MAG: hypothetical protein EA421_15955 [Gemmatimonadales bacterium]|nr:MAG: hypothetical protein EA421_15955 [Gemmatimonadales bacterium]